MTVCLNDFPDDCGGSPKHNEVMSAVGHILASPIFTKAPRMRQLLSFLIEKKLTGNERDLNEYTIGLEVFGRDCRSYDTGVDPVVRVQVGRLRERLLAYYNAPPAAITLEIFVPSGSYIPQIKGVSLPAASIQRATIFVKPLRNLALENPKNAFVFGLDDEIGSRLFEIVGTAALRLGERSSRDNTLTFPGGITLRLEGSVRVEKKHVRACMRLIDAHSGSVAWQRQFDGSGALDISSQEQLAEEICAGVRPHLVAGNPLLIVDVTATV